MVSQFIYFVIKLLFTYLSNVIQIIFLQSPPYSMYSYLSPKQCTSAKNTLLTINSMQKKLIPIDKISDNNEFPRL